MNRLRLGLALTLLVALWSTPPGWATSVPGPCLPPGISSDVLSWPTDDARTITIPTESGPARAALLERYRGQDGRSVVLIWVRGQIVFADAAPDNPSVPPWVDTGVLSMRGKVLFDTPTSPCQWRVLGGDQA